MRDIKLHTDNVWFFSDPHFYHKNLCVGSSYWPDKLIHQGRLTEAQNMLEYGLRKFNDEVEMTDHIIDSINSRVDNDSVVFCLGDWCFGGVNKIIETRKRIKCKELHLILGNHDKDIRYNKSGVQSIFTSVSEAADVYINNQHIVLSHYSMRIWNKSHRGTWQLYGHSHGHLPQHVDKDGNPYRTMDVGMDAIYKEFGEYKPISFTELNDIMKDRITTKIDHHR